METEEERLARRRNRLREMKRKKRRMQFINQRVIPAVGLAVLLVCVFGAASAIKGQIDKSRSGQQEARLPKAPSGQQEQEAPPLKDPGAGQEDALLGRRVCASLAQAGRKVRAALPASELIPVIYEAYSTDDTQGFGEDIVSKYGIFIDLEKGAILAQKDAREQMSPASMTKILTLLVAAEHVEEGQLDDTVPITIDITDYCYVNECSVVGFSLNERVPVRDLFYGTILPSGADAAVALAVYVAGSHEAFVDMMNEKLKLLGLSETTHFTNCVGLYDENHYSTAYDIAMILKAASDNQFCREILSAHTYNTARTEQHPEGLLISNWFLRRIEDRDTHGEVLCGKTGYVAKSGSCAASLGVDRDGREYICVTAGSSTTMQCLADQVAVYQSQLP